jgi:hypothetical protein
LVTNNQQAVSSLLHLSSACAAQALPGTLPYGARTFLPLSTHECPISDDCLANSGRGFYAGCQAKTNIINTMIEHSFFA